ncbi:MAG: 4a-hydroxytetrahydrobiopterin dehydratase [Ardenticatenaceae bacterium]|nr:4a-hydroxytetrahydrobiopterin dehydratase [Ardenticatenaceae bacterium]MCB8986265.1 4a-hydroxytetrahydrobiopterin dehydratase [Ardenticatenaceae bacterium]
MARHKLNDEELQQALNGLSGWSVQDGKLHKEFKFASFAQAMGWMVTVALAADKLDHHPEWCNVYNRVTVDLATHDLGNAISNLDVTLAQKMEEAI